MLPRLPLSFLSLFFYGLLVAIPLGIRSFYSGQLVYATDILMILFLAASYFKFRGIFWRKPKFLFLFVFFAALSSLFASPIQPAIYNFFRLVLLVFVSLAAANCLRTGEVNMRGVARVLGFSAAIQATLGFMQFLKQGSLGLGFFGEPLISPTADGVAKVVIGGAKLIRAYGTFPHPNILAAFLVIGFAALVYLWLNRASEWKPWSSWRNLLSDLTLGVGIFVTSLGLLLSFSRSSWLVATLLAAAVIIVGVVTKINFRQSIRLAILMLAIGLSLFIGFSEHVVTRAKIVPGEPALTQRAVYNDIGLEIITARPLGVGIGNQVLFADKQGFYESRGMTDDWQKQPIHNLYLLMATEIGIVGALMFLLFIFRIISADSASLTLGALLLIGMTDHFLWTSQSGQLMLWLTIGLVIGLNRASSEGARS